MGQCLSAAEPILDDKVCNEIIPELIIIVDKKIDEIVAANPEFSLQTSPPS